MTRTLLTSFLLLLGVLSLSAQQSIFGTVTDETGEPVIGANIAIYKGSDLVTGNQTDFDGNYRINLDPGTYDVEFSYVGYTPRKTQGFTVYVGQENKLDLQFENDGGIVLEEAIVTAYKVDPMKVDETSQGLTLTSEDVKKLGTRSVNAIASLSAGATSADEGDAVSIRGNRSDATRYMVDGVLVTGTLIPESEIDQIQVVTGGVEAKYGDLTGGVISITTKGPSSKFSGSVYAETSKYLDPFNNNLVGGSISGPILKTTLEDGSKRSLLGFRLSGRYTYRQDDDPPATDIYYITDETRKRLEENPIVRLAGGGFAQSASFLEEKDVQVLNAQPFEAYERLDFTGKLDARINSAIDVTLSGTYADESDQFTPSGSSRTEDNWRLLNAHNNPFDKERTMRGNFRFRHKLGSQSGNDTSSVLSNAQYVLKLGFQRYFRNIEDARHKDNFFNYGYVGKFNFDNVAVFDTSVTTGRDGPEINVRHTGYRQTFTGYTPSDINPVLSNYNKLGFESTDGLSFENFLIRNGVVSSIVSDGVYSLHSSIGNVYNLYRRDKNDLITLNLETQFDLRPKGGKFGRHNIQLGVLYEQRVNRRYNLNPRSLWITANSLANAPLQGVDSTNVLRTEQQIFSVGGVLDTVNVDVYGFNFDKDAVSETTSKFFYEIRKKLNLGNTDWVNVDALDPSLLDLSMFSAAEATSRSTLDYYGYDYQGNEVSSNIAWDDFFTAKNEEGQRTFPVAPISPIYFAGYLQDKFTFNNIILRAGVRMDYFDANTKVLKDPYELYDVQTAGDFDFSTQPSDYVRPSNIPDDAKVYIESEDNQRVKAYRVEDTWFTANGRQVNRGSEIFTSTQVPAYVAKEVYAEDGQNYIRSDNYNPDASFKDYEAQINFMPRLAFSFPISDDANFFAHYDVLVQRPPSNTAATALDYFYWFQNISRSGYVANNPNLKPTKTVDYEAGFQQRISRSSALKVSFFVREMRDLVQQRLYTFAMGNAGQYTTYGNLDFGTVKGLNVSYDLRRTGPVSLRLSYALQFADGTGSNANSQSGNLTRGNLRTLYPLSYDERHRISGSLDYRYGKGEGPEVFGVRLLENFGVNLFGSAVSGRPYTRSIIPDQLSGNGTEGDINGARLPWNTTLNLRVDRDFELFNKNGKGVNLNVYLRVSNLLNQKNIISVYTATGRPDEDGYLQSPVGQTALASQINQDAYIRSYNWRMVNPNFYSLPRRIFVGTTIQF